MMTLAIVCWFIMIPGKADQAVRQCSNPMDVDQAIEIAHELRHQAYDYTTNTVRSGASVWNENTSVYQEERDKQMPDEGTSHD